MPDKLKEIYKKLEDMFWKLTKKFDGLSEKIYEQTGTKINFGIIIVGFFLVIFTIIIIKLILGWVMGSLLGG